MPPGERAVFEADLFKIWEMTRDSNVDDRSIAIVTAAYLEAVMVEVIACRLPVWNSEVRNTLFNVTSNAPLSTFMGKAHMCRALNAVAGDAYHDLKVIAKVRNIFAHQMRATSFSDPDVFKLVRALRHQDRSIAARREMEEEFGKDRYSDLPPPDTSPRGRYIESANMLGSRLVHIQNASAAASATPDR
jgi:hypothetical protein